MSRPKKFKQLEKITFTIELTQKKLLQRVMKKLKKEGTILSMSDLIRQAVNELISEFFK